MAEAVLEAFAAGVGCMRKVNVAVVGATGAVGEVMIEILAERNFPVAELHLLASERSEGTAVRFNGRSIRVKRLDRIRFRGCRHRALLRRRRNFGEHSRRSPRRRVVS